MNDYIFAYNGCCLYEVTVLAYFLSYSGREACICSPDGKPVKSQEGFEVLTAIAVADINPADASGIIIPGGKIDNLDSPCGRELLCSAHLKGVLIAAICAGADLLDCAGLLQKIKSTHSETADIVFDGGILTARANAYIDSAIEYTKLNSLFRDEADLAETLAFWKEQKNIQS